MSDKKGAAKGGAADSRLEFLRKALRTAAYTAPIVAAMSMRNASAAMLSAPLGKGKGKGKGP